MSLWRPLFIYWMRCASVARDPGRSKISKGRSGTEVPQGVRGQSPGRESGAKSPSSWWSSANYTTVTCSERKTNNILLTYSIIINSGFISDVHVRYMLSPVRLSVVCNVRAPYSGGSNFRQYFYGIWYLGHPNIWQPPVSCIQTFNRLSNPFDNRFNNRLYGVYSRLSKTGCTTGLTTGCIV